MLDSGRGNIGHAHGEAIGNTERTDRIVEKVSEVFQALALLAHLDSKCRSIASSIKALKDASASVHLEPNTMDVDDAVGKSTLYNS